MYKFAFTLVLLVLVGLCFGDPPVDSDDFTPLKLFEGTYAVSGFVVNYLPFINYYVPAIFAEMHVKEADKKVYADLGQAVYWGFEDASYLVFPYTPDATGLCYRRTDFTFDDQNTEYGKAVSFDKPELNDMSFIGHVLDIGSCCDAISVSIDKHGNQIKRWNLAQFFPRFAAFGGPVVYNSVVVERVQFNKTIHLDESKFDLPSACLNEETIVDYCPNYYDQWGWCDLENNCAVPFNTTTPFRRAGERYTREHVVPSLTRNQQ